ncbi:MAG TPA: ornithine cyclodeaminase family protein [Acidimicrobiales bacterium]|nr:ornithine cyclodeaminase family protein [Acidimicrobiales bacterium]
MRAGSWASDVVHWGMRFIDATTLDDALGPLDAVTAVTAALRAGLDPAADPPRALVPTRHGHFLLMPAESGVAAGVKVATVAPGNPAAGRPRIQATYLLFDAESLTLRAVLDGTALTNRRTAAVSFAAVGGALDRLEGPVRVVVFGGGPQALAHLDTAAAVLGRRLGAVTVALRRPDRATAEVVSRGAVVSGEGPALAAALGRADLVICATTSRTPLFGADAIPPGTVVVAVGSHEPDARELDPALLARATVVVEDVATATREAGDVVLALEEGALSPEALVPLASVARGGLPPRTDRPLVFKSVGMAWEDLVVARAVVDRLGS